MSGMTVARLIDAVKQMQPEAIHYNDTAAVTLWDDIVNVVVKPNTEGERLPTVNLAERVAEILGLSVQPDYRPGQLEYKYSAGSETARFGQRGSLLHTGRYHPNVACEGQNVCKWCGIVL